MTPGTEGDWLHRALRVLALGLRHHVALARALRGDADSDKFMGLLLTADQAETMLAEASGALRASGTAASAAALDELETALERERGSLQNDPFCNLATALELEPLEVQVLLLATAPAIDPRFGAVYDYLNDEITRRHLTPELAARLLAHRGVSLRIIRQPLADTARLCRSGTLRLGAAQPWIQAPLRLDDLLLDRLLEVSHEPSIPAGYGTVLPLTGQHPITERDKAPGIWLIPDTPDGRGALLALQLARSTGSGVLLLEPEQYGPAAGEPPQWIRSALREAALNHLLPVLRGFDVWDAAQRAAVARVLVAPAVVLSPHPVLWQHSMGSLAALPPATHSRSQALELLLANHPADEPQLRHWLEPLTHPDPLVLGALLHSHHEPRQLRETLRLRLDRPLARLAEPLRTGYRLDDLVLPTRARQALTELASWHVTGPRVRDQWDFGRVFGRGSGTTALFKGPSGTGKTMAAAAVGNHLQLPVFRVNLATLISKYIGETEKNLDRLFEAADGSDVVLFFDEANAIFGKRSEVHDAHDRYANLETAYLLQRIERHAGICILASNLHQNIDEAFTRRLDVIVEFPAPNPPARQQIWQRLQLGRATLAEDIDFALLAERFELSGGEIRNCALTAAHLAAANGEVITMELLMRSIARELAKAGKPIRRRDFGAHYGSSRSGKES